MAYTMIAERETQKIRKQRESALIVLANAKAMQSEGWQVVITDEDGNSVPLAEFEAGLAEKFSSWYQAPKQPVAMTVPAPNVFSPSVAADAEPEAIVAAELAAEAAETTVSDVPQIDEDDFESADAANTADREKVGSAGPAETVLGPVALVD